MDVDDARGAGGRPPAQTGEDGDDEVEAGGFEGWSDEELAPTRCIFTDKVFDSASACLAHAASEYGLDLVAVARAHKLDVYGCVRLVNYVRAAIASPGSAPDAIASSVRDCTPGGQAPWDDDANLVAALADDPLLYSLPPLVGADDEWNEEDGGDEMASVEAEAAMAAVVQMREQMARMIDEEGESRAGESQDGGGGRGGRGAEGDEAEGEESSGYFGSYGRLAIHEEMLADAVRTEAYRDAIESNRALFEGKVVLDVGCGTAILSMFAARAGAKVVFGIDASEIIDHARAVVAANGLSDRISLHRAEVESWSLPSEACGVALDGHVDIIISEWMGYLLLYESMLPSVLNAASRLLRPQGGLLLPSACEMLISASSHDRLGFWNDVYGFTMAPIASAAIVEASVEVVPAPTLLAGPSTFRRFELCDTTDAHLDFTAPFSISAHANGTLRCFVVHFDTFFDLSSRGGTLSSFSTAPGATPTHWKQTALYLRAPLELHAGDAVAGVIGCVRAKEYRRGYDVSVTCAARALELTSALATESRVLFTNALAFASRYAINGGDQHTQLFKLH